ncbi:MAG: hypothetical protein R3E12_10750 [Candidatus Eisenbacteria bacterium]|uniref:Bacterial spore germination immunoglobulin-like domain-containing protein n=1 Tax=Eiseniibacteriota bacterium TaxID=2212470 RepID=A0A956LYW6_UNCEI|nr:hypothetical protein [Candidatus Eisenbacteria bacterium]
MKRLSFVLALASLMTVTFGCSDTQTSAPAAPADVVREQAVTQNPGIIPPQARPHGLSYSEWSEIWWQWLFSIPIDENPGLDPDGRFVALNQSGQVWFLAPNFGGGQVDVRYATIPAGKMLFIDIAAILGSPALGDPEDIDELYALISALVDGIVEVSFSVDGAIAGVEGYRVRSGLFRLELPENNVLGLEPGSYFPAAAEGYYVMLAPLSAGDHTLHIFADFGEVFGTSDVTFHLAVE